MRKYKSRKYLKKRGKRYTRKNKSLKKRRGGDHTNKNLEHWHLRVRFPNGSTRQMPEAFVRTGVGEDSPVESGKIRDIYYFVRDQGITEPFTLYWQGKKLDNLDRKIRDIQVNGETIKLYDRDSDKPIVVILNKDLDPMYVESHDLSPAYYGPQTPR